MFLVYRAVQSVEREALKYSFASYKKSKKNTMNMSRRVMLQGVLYSAVLFILIIVAILAFILSALDTSFSVELLASIIFPSQGFWNVLIYLIPTFKKWIEKRYKPPKNLTTVNQQGWW